MTTLLAILLAANLFALLGFYARDLWNKLTYLYYKVKAAEIEPTAAVVHQASPRSGAQSQSADPNDSNSAHIIKPLTPAQIRRRKEYQFRAKNNL